MPRPRAPLTLLAALAAAAVGAGCGVPETVVVKGATLDVRLEEYRFVPSQLRARPGPLEIRTLNVGTLAHNLELDRAGKRVVRLDTTKPGERASATVRLRPGTYRLVCTLGNHDDLGMHGKLVVR
jgi:plastocyanin